MIGGDLLIAERFGPTFQGEGPSTGQQALFIRLSRCNLSCRWCDTAFTWDWSRFDPREESRRVPVEELIAWVLWQDVPLVVITGGEPLIQQTRLVPLLKALAEAERVVEIETNGTIAPSVALVTVVERFNVSPKLSGSGLPQHRRIDERALRAFAATGKAVFKFVVSAMAELDEVSELVELYGLSPVWIMPEGSCEWRVITGMRQLADQVLRRGWNLSSRLQVLLWGDVRGR